MSPNVRFVTNSELSTYLDCRRRWWLSYYRRLTPIHEKTVGPLTLGTRVHYALQALHDTEMFAAGIGPLDAYDDLGATDRERLDAQYVDDEYGVPAEVLKQFQSELELGRIMVEGYLEWLAETGADSEFEVIGAEEKVDVPFAEIRGRTVRLLGKFDLRVRRLRDGARLFIDYKTCGSISGRLQTIQMEQQFLMYQLLERLHGAETGQTEMTQGSMVGLLRKVKRTATAKPPFYFRAEVHHSDVELRGYYNRVYHEITDLLRLEDDLKTAEAPAQVAYPRPSRDCTWKCQFKLVCPMFDDGSDAERFLADNFVEYDPLTRYDDTMEKTTDE